MLRSKYAAPDTPTYVELTFDYGGKSCQVRGAARSTVSKTRGTGNTKQAATAELHLSNERSYQAEGRSTAIRDIIGLTGAQFSQIAHMISQGGFRKLLQAGTEAARFSGYFRTKFYDLLQKQAEGKRPGRWARKR